MTRIIIAYLLITLTTHAFSQTPNKSTFPFEIAHRDGHYSITAQIESAALFDTYGRIFQKYNYSGNGYCWEGHIIQILEKVDKELLKHIQFDPEAGAFFAYADSKESQQKFVDLLSPIFSDVAKLEKYILSADRRRIDD